MRRHALNIDDMWNDSVIYLFSFFHPLLGVFFHITSIFILLYSRKRRNTNNNNENGSFDILYIFHEKSKKLSK